MQTRLRYPIVLVLVLIGFMAQVSFAQSQSPPDIQKGQPIAPNNCK